MNECARDSHKSYTTIFLHTQINAMLSHTASSTFNCGYARVAIRELTPCKRVVNLQERQKEFQKLFGLPMYSIPNNYFDEPSTNHLPLIGTQMLYLMDSHESGIQQKQRVCMIQFFPSKCGRGYHLTNNLNTP